MDATRRRLYSNDWVFSEMPCPYESRTAHSYAGDNAGGNALKLFLSSPKKFGVGLEKSGVGLEKSGVALGKSGVALEKSGLALEKSGVGLEKFCIGPKVFGVGLGKNRVAAGPPTGRPRLFLEKTQ